jgi:hypothetical protein
MGAMETSFTLLMLRRFATRLALLVSSTWTSLRQNPRH